MLNASLQYAGVIEAYLSQHTGKCSTVCCRAALVERRNVQHWSVACWTSTHIADAASSLLVLRNSTNTSSTSSIPSYQLNICALTIITSSSCVLSQFSLHVFSSWCIQYNTIMQSLCCHLQMAGGPEQCTISNQSALDVQVSEHFKVVGDGNHWHWPWLYVRPKSVLLFFLLLSLL